LYSAPPVSHQLNVSVATDRPQYRPGETAQYTVQVSSPDGKPAAGAELSLGVVDEAIYAIRRDMTQDPLAFFATLSYQNTLSQNHLDPGDQYGLIVGAALAVSPETRHLTEDR